MSELGFIPKDDLGKPGPVLRPGVESSLGEGDIMQHEPGTIASLWSNLRDVFFPVKLPPLVLESKPIQVVDRMATKQDPRATAGAFLIYGLVILLSLWVVKLKLHQMSVQKEMLLTDLKTPPPMPLAKALMGGGGGQRGPTPVSKGHLPKFAKMQITPPKAPPMEQPKIQMPEPTIEVQPDLKMANSTLPNFGMPNSPLVGNSMGNGKGSGIGSGSGSGLEAGSDGGYGGGVMQVGGGVTGPVPIYQPDPEFSEEARKAKFQGIVTVQLIVDKNGLPQDVHVTQGVGMGLDQKAVEAVQHYRFKPARQNGKPVAVYLNVEVNFEIF